MNVEKVRVNVLKGWTDGPKVVLDYFAFWRSQDMPPGVHLISVHPEYDVVEMIKRYSPVATYYVTAYRYTIEQLANTFPSITFYELEELLDERRNED